MVYIKVQILFSHTSGVLNTFLYSSQALRYKRNTPAEQRQFFMFFENLDEKLLCSPYVNWHSKIICRQIRYELHLMRPNFDLGHVWYIQTELVLGAGAKLIKPYAFYFPDRQYLFSLAFKKYIRKLGLLYSRMRNSPRLV